jgi:murein DD-endopeptidase MepM/ murein hydrolase activator NlpD
MRLKGSFSAFLAWGALLFVLMGWSACYKTYGVYHEVRPGENLYRIALAYKVDVQELAEINDIQPPDTIQVGQRVFIPGVKKAKHTRLSESYPHVEPGSREPSEEEATQIRTFRGKFIWPVHATLTSRYGMRQGNMHDGIDLGAKKGTPIRASAGGRVIYADQKLRGYGKMIIIKHEGVYSSVYAHNDVHYVKKNDFVEKGDIIGRVGSTGRSSGPHLHFEIRKGRKTVNPLFYLPKK